MNGPVNDDWMDTTREAPEFRLDVGFYCPDYARVQFSRNDGDREESGIATSPFSLVNGFVLSSEAQGREDELSAYYRRLLERGSPFSSDVRVRQFQCLDVDLFVTFKDEHPLRIEQFGAAALGCKELLSQLANRQEPAGELYDNLDQGWALRILLSAEEVFSLEWDWEGPEDWKTHARALRFDRRRLAEQAEAALSRLLVVHRRLVESMGEDYWNTPPRIASR